MLYYFQGGGEMEYISVAEAAKRWEISERSVRNYCACGAVLNGKTWQIPETSEKPARLNKKSRSLLEILQEEKSMSLSGGIYHKIQIELTYNSNHIEGSRLTHDQTRYIFETNTVDGIVSVDDVVETANHFRCVDIVIDNANYPLSEAFIKELHRTLKNGTSDSRKEWFAVGEYKKFANEVGGHETTAPKDVPIRMRQLIAEYNSKLQKSLEDILDFHYRFEKIHPFQDGNGRVGRLIMFKECLRCGVMPFIIGDDMKMFYYKGLEEWEHSRERLLKLCEQGQVEMEEWVRRFGLNIR